MTEPVLITGAGPVGLMLACELGLRGVPTVVLEHLDQPSERSFGMAINGTVVELLAQRGIMDTLRGDGFEFPMAHFAHLMLDPTRLGGGRPFNFAVPHARVQQRLEERAVSLGVEIRRDTKVISVEQDEAGVLVGVRVGALGGALGGARAGGSEQAIRGSYLVGCDGGDSTVRKLAGIGFPGSDLVFSGITGDIEVEDGDPLWSQLGSHQHDAGLFTVAPGGPGLLRVTTGEFGVQPEDPKAAVTLEELRASALRIAGYQLDTGRPRWLSRWGASTRVADSYRQGRVFLAGDAAHLCFPLGGQALSTGIEDAVNLGWKLAAAVNGWAPPALLDSYHAERHPVATRVAMTTKAQAALMHPMAAVSPIREVLTELIQFDDVNAYLVNLVGAFDVRYPAEGQSHSLAGTRLPGVPLTAAGAGGAAGAAGAAGASTSVAELLAGGRGLFLDFSAGDWTDRAGDWLDRVDVVAADPVPEIGAAAVLVRPDGRVAWAAGAGDAGDAGAELAEALGAWFGEPAAQPVR
jgi:2-polyprenyl-6-methoxyphenol hydroxylase-like FAD-dependent oxidoreductase